MLRPIRIPVTSLSRMLAGTESMALFDRTKKPATRSIQVRVAGDGERILFGPVQSKLGVVEITATGYRVLKESPV